MNRHYLILGCICASLFFCGFRLGNYYPEQHLEPMVKYVPVEKAVVVEKPVITDRVVEIPIGVVAEASVELRDFASVTELRQWLAEDDTDQHIFLKANNDGVIKLTGCCEDYALQLQDEACQAGYKMSVQIIGDDEYYKHYGKHLSRGHYHAINLVRVGNEFWYIEPQTDECWLGANLD